MLSVSRLFGVVPVSWSSRWSSYRLFLVERVGLFALLFPVLVLSGFWTNAAPLPLQGAQAIVWLEGPLGRSLPLNLLRDCYVADPSQRPLPVVCLD